MALNFNKYAQEANEFMNKLADSLGHPQETARAGIVLRAVMHTLRDRITISESFDVMAQLPMFLKAVYVENWKYLESPKDFKTIDEFKDEVKRLQDQYGEQEFSWDRHTEDIIAIVFEEISNYLTEGQTRHILDQLPKEIEILYKESLKH